MQIMLAEGFLVPKLTVWRITLKYKVHGMISHLSGSDSPLKLYNV